MLLDSNKFARKKRTKKKAPTARMAFDTKVVYKIIVDRAVYFAQCTRPAERTVDTSITKQIRTSEKPLDMQSVTKMTFGLDETLRRPVSIKFIGDAPKKMSGTVLVSPYQLLVEASSDDISRLVMEADIDHPLLKAE